MDRATGEHDAAHADAALVPAAAAAAPPDDDHQPPQPPTAWVAHSLIGPAGDQGADGLLYVASSERRADEVGRALRQFAPAVEVLVLPPWDCLPYDRASPSRECMGRRAAVLARLSEPPSGPRVLVASAEAMLQRTPPATVLKAAFMTLSVGDILDRVALEAFATAAGYVFDDRIDEPGEIALLGEVIDIFPPASDAPVRISLGPGDAIVEIKCYDPLSQRTEDAVGEVLLGPASELILPSDAPLERVPGVEHRLPEIYGKMDSVLDRAAGFRVAQDPRASARAVEFAAQAEEAWEARRSLGDADAERLLKPERLYLSAEALLGALDARSVVALDAGSVARVPNFALEPSPGRAFSDYVQARLEHGRRVCIAGLGHELRPLVRALQRGLERRPDSCERWADLVGAPPGALLALEADLEAGYEDASGQLVLIAASDVLGGRVAARTASGGAGLVADPDLRVGDVVLHEDHGLGVLKALERVEVDGVERDALRLEYHGGANLLVPIEEFDRVWRYGAEAEAVTLDRLHTDAWARRRAELSSDIDRTAAHLVELAATRARTRGVVLAPPKAAYARFAARFPYPETPDQAGAIAAVLEDMSSGRVMNRLVCGDVGFGKTEVALRAAAAAALCGKQVAVVAPTTVLARQHYESFRRRFEGTGVQVGRLSRLVSSAEADRVKQGLADGSIGVVVGTHALAGKDIAFRDLALLIIDEEQRFGAKLKAQLRDLAPDAHLLTMTATPIPRTLQLAMVGVEDVSVIATPPARRRPIRTFLAPYDAATVRTALLRERRRGGQSFVVAPRIEDIAPLADELKRLAPELTTRIAHGALAPDEVDEVMVGFAAGEGDVLLATNIIESGLDVPRANTMLVWRADLFGLSQLHQLRGRVGRGRTQGVTYLMHDPASELPEATRARLSTLEAFDRLGSGLAISARDLELRGAGDLIGDEQAGHVKLIGTALYQRLLTRAVRVAKGELDGPEWTPEVRMGLTGAFPESYVPDPTTRINLYARLARLTELEAVEGFAEELEDRFGAPPAEAQGLLDLARIQALARGAGVLRIDAGPKAIAFTLASGFRGWRGGDAGLDRHEDGRFIHRRPATEGANRADEVRALLATLGEPIVQA
jgi:transcription-repair coupling factor (superfamily II helicase)